MLTFPQLSTGAAAQFPITRRRSRRTVHNLLADGRMVAYSDPGVDSTEWDLRYRGLSGAESKAIEDLFQATEGRLRKFTLVDPTANLLAWSEDFTKPCWVVDPMIQITAGVADPFGSSRARRLINAGQAAQRVVQTIAGPASFVYCLSCYVRSDGGSLVRLVRSCGSAVEELESPAGTEWRRVVSAGSLNSQETSVSFAMELSPGASVEVFGMQSEAQPSASGYKRTGTRGGIYSARFDQDSFEFTAEGPDQMACALRLTTVNGD